MKKKMVGTAGFSAVVEITKSFEPATDGSTVYTNMSEWEIELETARHQSISAR